ncbi:MAG: short chain dehydrogenase [Bacteroidota bacterium]
MKIIVVGASGTIGKRLTEELGKRHEVVKASFSKSDVKVDITSRASIENMYHDVGKFDAVISVTGSAYFGAFEKMTEEDLYMGIRSKLMGQINLVMVGKNYINAGGSFTLTSGILSEDPIRDGAALSMVNSGVNGFVVGAAVEFQRGIRLNVVSPGLVDDSKESLGRWFPGHTTVAMNRVVDGYLKSVEGVGTGRIIRVY